jgi:hypothetical protein
VKLDMSENVQLRRMGNTASRRVIHIGLFARYYYGYQIKEDGLGKACSAHGSIEKSYRIVFRKL